MKKTLSYTRWALVPVAAAGGFCAAVVLGFLAFALATFIFHVPEEGPEGLMILIPMLLGVAAAPPLFIGFGTMAAPSHKRDTIKALLLVGSLLTLWICKLKMWPLAALALASGSLSAWLLRRKHSA